MGAPVTDLGLVDLDDLEATDVGLVGAKAAPLAAARRRGLPVLPGFVVPASHGRRLTRELYSRRDGAGEAGSSVCTSPYQASLELMDRVSSGVDLAVVAARAERLATRVVARSSSPDEADPRWSGVLSSFVDIEPAQLPTAIAGCWASVLLPAAIETCALIGVTPEQACPAVLIQPFLDAEASGIATAGQRAGTVNVVAVWGSPDPLLSGWVEGWNATVKDGVVSGAAVDPDSCPRTFPPALIATVASLAEQAAEGRSTTIEWAARDGRPTLLQVKPAPPAPGPSSRSEQPRWAVAFPKAALHPAARFATGLVARFGGPLGDALVLPLLLASGPVLMGEAQAAWRRSLTPESQTGPERFLRACSSADALADAAWPEGPATAMAALASGDLTVLASGHPVAPSDLVDVMADFASIAGSLVAAGVIAQADQLWSLEKLEVLEALDHPRPARWASHRLRRRRWQPLMMAVTSQLGERRMGAPGAPGVGVGPPCWLGSSRDVPRMWPGAVAVVRHLAPQFAPALWVASGLVAESGGRAAHLLEVARSLRVPAVVGVGGVRDSIDLILVDGDLGGTAWLG